MPSYLKTSARAILRWLRGGQCPQPGEWLDPWYKGRSPNLKGRYALAYTIWLYIERPLSWELMIGDLFRYFRKRLDHELTKELGSREEFSSTYWPAHKALWQVVQSISWFPDDIRANARTWLDYSHTVEALCSSPDRRAILGPDKGDRLRSGVLVNPPCQRTYGGPEDRRRTWNSVIFELESIDAPDVDWSKPGKESTAEIWAMCIAELSHRGVMHYPEPASVDRVRLAAPFLWEIKGWGWSAMWHEPVRVNRNNGHIDMTRGLLRAWHTANAPNSIIVGRPAAAPTPPPPSPVPPPDPHPSGSHVLVARSELTKHADLLDSGTDPHAVAAWLREVAS